MPMKPLRILYVVTTFPSVTETFIASQVADMVDKGHDCTLFAYNPGTDTVVHQMVSDYGLTQRAIVHFKNAKTRWGVFKGMVHFAIRHFFSLDYPVLFSLLLPTAQQAERRKLYWDMPVFLLRKRFDVIHSHFGFNGVKVARFKKVGLLLNSRCIVTFHGSDLTPSKVSEYRSIYADMFTHFDAFTVNTPYLKKILEQVAPSLKSVSVLPVGFHPRYLEPYLHLPKRPQFTLVFCGRFIALKGPDRALDLLSCLKNQGYSDIQLLMIGEGPLEAQLRQQAIDLGIASQIRWTGALSQEAVFDWMGRSHVFIYTGLEEPETGRAETQGLVIQEAQFLKLPVVVHSVGGVSYGLLKNESGFLIDSEDMVIFASAITSLFNDPSLRDAMGEKGHAFVCEHYTASQLGNLLLAIYENRA